MNKFPCASIIMWNKEHSLIVRCLVLAVDHKYTPRAFW